MAVAEEVNHRAVLGMAVLAETAESEVALEMIVAQSTAADLMVGSLAVAQAVGGKAERSRYSSSHTVKWS